jgi:hypothetical protein
MSAGPAAVFRYAGLPDHGGMADGRAVARWAAMAGSPIE